MDPIGLILIEQDGVGNLILASTEGGKIPEVSVGLGVEELEVGVILHLEPRIYAGLRRDVPPFGLGAFAIKPDLEGPVNLGFLAAGRIGFERRIKESILVERLDFEPRRVQARLEGRVDNASDSIGDLDVFKVDGVVNVDFHVCMCVEIGEAQFLRLTCVLPL